MSTRTNVDAHLRRVALLTVAQKSRHRGREPAFAVKFKNFEKLKLTYGELG
jgi:hypothetical protein